MLQVERNEVLLLYNGDDKDDKQALVYIKSLPNIRLKSIDLAKESMTPTQIAEISDMLHMEPVEMIDQWNESDRNMSNEDALDYLSNAPKKMKSPITVTKDSAAYWAASYDIIKKQMSIPDIHAELANKDEKSKNRHGI